MRSNAFFVIPSIFLEVEPITYCAQAVYSSLLPSYSLVDVQHKMEKTGPIVDSLSRRRSLTKVKLCKKKETVI